MRIQSNNLLPRVSPSLRGTASRVARFLVLIACVRHDLNRLIEIFDLLPEFRNLGVKRSLLTLQRQLTLASKGGRGRRVFVEYLQIGVWLGVAVNDDSAQVLQVLWPPMSVSWMYSRQGLGVGIFTRRCFLLGVTGAGLTRRVFEARPGRASCSSQSLSLLQLAGESLSQRWVCVQFETHIANMRLFQRQEPSCTVTRSVRCVAAVRDHRSEHIRAVCKIATETVAISSSILVVSVHVLGFPERGIILHALQNGLEVVRHDRDSRLDVVVRCF